MLFSTLTARCGLRLFVLLLFTTLVAIQLRQEVIEIDIVADQNYVTFDQRVLVGITGLATGDLYAIWGEPDSIHQSAGGISLIWKDDKEPFSSRLQAYVVCSRSTQSTLFCPVDRIISSQATCFPFSEPGC